MINITKHAKAELFKLVKLLADKEFTVMTPDGGETYILLNKKDKRSYSPSWAELCINYVPKKLGINYLIIPTNEDFNIIDYFIEYYNQINSSKKENIIEKTVNNPYDLDGSL